MKKPSLIATAAVCVLAYFASGFISGKWYNDFQKRIDSDRATIAFLEKIEAESEGARRQKSLLETDAETCESLRDAGMSGVFSPFYTFYDLATGR